MAEDLNEQIQNPFSGHSDNRRCEKRLRSKLSAVFIALKSTIHESSPKPYHTEYSPTCRRRLRPAFITFVR